MPYYSEPDVSAGARREQQNFLDGSKAKRPGPRHEWTTKDARASTAGKFCNHQNRFFRELVSEMVEP